MNECSLAADFSVVHPLHPSASAQAAVTAGKAAEARASDKVAMYGAKCKERSWDFWAGSRDYGGMESVWSAVFQTTRARALRSGEPLVEALAAVWIEVSRALARGVARQLVRARQTVR